MSFLTKGLRLNLNPGIFRSLAVRHNIQICKNFSSTEGSEKKLEAVKERFDKLVKSNKVVVFMKGVPEEPRCGFSNAVVQIFRMHGVEGYAAHDVLADESIRQGVKDYSNWPTIPQIYINGEFLGGCDIMVEMHKNGTLVDTLKKAGIQSALESTATK